ncbi:MAG: tetratricopeptide repeat protein [Bacteroidia bacterium]|nr:tetratricopeptide repeat protein [Bacteroidia bacterium]MDW8133994.1 tetratricopeptide repeat protein [Bacteroidia bacterium]
MAEEQIPKPEVETPSQEGKWLALWHRLRQNRLASIVSAGLVVLVVGWIAYRQYLFTQNEECLREMRFAEAYFRQDSFEKAIKGTATALGFEQLVKEYGSTEAGNLCRLYLGACYLKTGKYEAAVEVLSEYEDEDSYLGGVAQAALAGAYAELKKFEKAAKLYEEAADIHHNSQTSPVFLLQAGQCYELSKDWERAMEVYEELIEKYPTAGEVSSAQKHLARLRTAHAK